MLQSLRVIVKVCAYKLRMQNKTYTFEEAKQLLARYCAYQERSHQEVEQKLYKMGMIPEVKEQIIIHLLQHDFLNEERFSKAFVSGKFRIKKWGKIKITQALLQKGVSTANITIGLSEIDDVVYLECLENLVKRKYKNFLATLDVNPTTFEVNAIKQISFKNKQKVIHYLQQKGYELDLIYKCILDLKL